MKKHGAISIALAAIHKPVPGGAGNNHNFNAHFDFGAGNPLMVHVNPPGDDKGKSDVRNLVGRGFRSFLGKPNDDQVFRYKGKPIDHTDAVQLPLRRALMKLAYALEGPKADGGAPEHSEADKAGRRNVEPGDNPNIPSGYAYLMQLIGHDIVQSASSLARTDDGRIALSNERSAMLRLESIYNGGPEASPLLYEAGSAGGNAPKSYLRLGPFDTDRAFVCPFRDLARVDLAKATADVKQRLMDPPPPPPGSPVVAPVDGKAKPKVLVPLPDVIVGDSRNDDHAILSQLTVLFHLLHNGLVKWAEGIPAKNYFDNAPEGAIDRYYFGRMAATLIFRNIVRLDVMQRLLHPKVHELYSGKKPPRICAFDGRIPLEFTHGAMRVCHAMLRKHYVFNERRGFFLNDVLMENSANRADRMPLPESWAIAWSNFFFDVDPANREQVNLSARLRPRYDPQTQVAPLFDGFDDMTKPGLAYRDMLSAALAGLWSAPAMMAKLAADTSAPELAKIFQQAKLADRACREKALRTWLATTYLEGFELKPDELSALAEDPPLPFFLMFEAMNDPDSRGLRLGPLGSVIVAEVVFGILNDDPLTPPDKVSLEEQLGYLHDNVFGYEAKKQPFPTLDKMAQLVRFVSELHELDHAHPRFI